MVTGEPQLFRLVQLAVESEEFRALMQAGNYTAAFKLAGLDAPTPEQEQVLQSLAADWRPLQQLAAAFGLPGQILN